MTFASVFQSAVFISLVKSWSMVVGPMPSKTARTLSFFFTDECLLTSLFGALEFAGEEIIHHQRCDERAYSKILLRIIVEHMKFELVATVDETRKKFVYTELFLISPLAD